jgi:BirA family biotin operon repressor/biotin-[acetyl-CoA-carboxylase] ligase
VRDVAARIGVDAVLKWPNDVLAGPGRGKCAGILSEAVAGDELAGDELSVVLGVGLNVLPLGEDVPAGPGGLAPTSLAEQGATTTDRTEIAGLLLAALAERELSWRGAGGDLTKAGLLPEYRHHCATIGQDVNVLLPDGEVLSGRASDVDSAGQLVVSGRTIFAGDVVHVRQA